MPNKRIMIVEDEWIVAEEIKRCFQKLGYTVSSVVASGEDAFQKAEEDRPDLVLMDIILQGEMDGIEAAKQIRSRLNIPVVYLTAYADKKVLERAKTTEPFGYLIKPFEERELYATIEMALYKHKIEEEKNNLIQQLRDALAEVKKLSGLLPICASCKKVRDDKGYWNEIEAYVRDHSEADFSHGLCPDCGIKLYPDLYEDEE